MFGHSLNLNYIKMNFNYLTGSLDRKQFQQAKCIGAKEFGIPNRLE